MTVTTLAVANGVLALLVVSALAVVVGLGLRIDRGSNKGSIVPAAPTTPELRAEELADAA